MYDRIKFECESMAKDLRELASRIDADNYKEWDLYNVLLDAAKDVKRISEKITSYFEK